MSRTDNEDDAAMRSGDLDLLQRRAEEAIANPNAYEPFQRFCQISEMLYSEQYISIRQIGRESEILGPLVASLRRRTYEEVARVCKTLIGVSTENLVREQSAATLDYWSLREQFRLSKAMTNQIHQFAGDTLLAIGEQERQRIRNEARLIEKTYGGKFRRRMMMALAGVIAGLATTSYFLILEMKEEQELSRQRVGTLTQELKILSQAMELQRASTAGLENESRIALIEVAKAKETAREVLQEFEQSSTTTSDRLAGLLKKNSEFSRLLKSIPDDERISSVALEQLMHSDAGVVAYVGAVKQQTLLEVVEMLSDAGEHRSLGAEAVRQIVLTECADGGFIDLKIEASIGQAAQRLGASDGDGGCAPLCNR